MKNRRWISLVKRYRNLFDGFVETWIKIAFSDIYYLIKQMNRNR